MSSGKPFDSAILRYSPSFTAIEIAKSAKTQLCLYLIGAAPISESFAKSLTINVKVRLK
jgi:hypothetical protein